MASESAALLTAASTHLGGVLAELYAASPSLAACGFTGSLVEAHANHAGSKAQRLLSSQAATEKFGKDDVLSAVTCVPSKLGVDMDGVEALISGSKSLFAGISR